MVNDLARKLSKPKKGITPILATLLLVVITVAAIVVTYAWIMTYTGHLIGQAGVVLNVTNTSFQESGTTIKIDVQNTGTSDTTIVQVYVGTSSSSMDNQTISPLLLPAGGHVYSIIVDYYWQTSVTYYFKIVASTGQNYPWSCESPDTYS
jgi:flagellin-like protein